MKRGILFAAAWLLIVVAAGYDTYFAWREREAFELWEMNPIVRWTAKAGGLQAVFLFKAAGLAFGIGLAIYCHFNRSATGTTVYDGSRLHVPRLVPLLCVLPDRISSRNRRAGFAGTGQSDYLSVQVTKPRSICTSANARRAHF